MGIRGKQVDNYSECACFLFVERGNIGLLPCDWEVKGFQTVPKY